MQRWNAGLALMLMAAGAEARDLDVPATAGWQHAATGIILMPKVDGASRTRLSDSTEGEYDISAGYSAPDQGLTVTVYIFHPAIPDAALWFDRALATLRASDLFKNGFTISAEPVAFAAAGATGASSLRQTYVVQNSPLRSTALAAVPLGDWLVTVRMSSEKLPAEALDARLQQFLAGIRWPKPPADSAAAVPIKPCAAPLAYAKKAKVVAPDMTEVLVSMAGALAAKKEADKQDGARKPPPVWCRDGEGTDQFGVYRSDPQEKSYAVAVADSGRVINVAPSLMSRGRYSTTFSDVDGTVSAHASFNALPKPEQAMALVMGGQPSSSSKGDKTEMYLPAGK